MYVVRAFENVCHILTSIFNRLQKRRRCSIRLYVFFVFVYYSEMPEVAQENKGQCPILVEYIFDSVLPMLSYGHTRSRTNDNTMKLQNRIPNEKEHLKDYANQGAIYN